MSNAIAVKVFIVVLFFVLLFNIDWTLGSIAQELKRMNDKKARGEAEK